jgi:hypothetical protein
MTQDLRDKFSSVQLKLLLVFVTYFYSNSVSSQESDISNKSKPFRIHGTTNLNLIGYYVNGIPYRADPFSAIFSANITTTFYGIELPLSFTISNKQENYSQPFNQFGMSPRWKWITLHLGYRNVTFSNFTLAGHTFFGAGIELNPGKFRFGAIYGRFDRVTTENPLYKNDSLPRFTSKGFAIKLGVGTENNFFDLIFLRIHDDSSTLVKQDTSASRLPEQNIVSGFNSRFTFFKKLLWETEAAISLYTTNLWAPTAKEIEDNSTFKAINNFFVINQSSEYYYAIRSSLMFRANNWSLKLEYKRIDPNYRSMGAYFFNNDLQNITISPVFGLFKRKLYMSGSLGFQNDNLRDTKKATSYRTIGNANISYNPSSKVGITIFYSNYSINQSPGRLPLNDTTRVIQVTHNFSITPRLFFFNSTRSHMVMLIYNLAKFVDNNRFTAGFSRFTAQTGMLIYTLALLQSCWSFNTGLNCILTNTSLSSYTGIGGTAGVSKTLLKDKLSLGWTNSLTRNYNDQGNGWVFNSIIISNFQVNMHNSFRFNIYFTGNYPDNRSVNPMFKEIKGDLTYGYLF